MIRTRDSRVRKQDTSRPFSCPFRGCYRSFKRISARTQHIRLCHGGNPSPLPIPSTPARINPTFPSPHHPQTAASAAEPSQHPSVSPLHAPQFSTPNNPIPLLYSTPTAGLSFRSVCDINTDDIYPSVSPLLESSTSTLAIPNLTSPYSPLGYTFESESSLDVDGDQIVPTQGPLGLFTVPYYGYGRTFYGLRRVFPARTHTVYLLTVNSNGTVRVIGWPYYGQRVFY